MPHTLFENSRTVFQAGGSFVNATYSGTGAPAYAADYEYHAIKFEGTVGNTGTLWAYGHRTSTGGGTTVIGSVIFGSSNAPGVIFEVKADTLTALGTDFVYLSGQMRVDSGGTLAGALTVLSTWPKSAGTTPAANGWGAVGTSLS
jgi:hypothetical protein